MKTFFDVVETFSPAFVLMENVMDIVKKEDGAYFKHALASLISLDYQARYGAIDAMAHGLPQGRWRCACMMLSLVLNFAFLLIPVSAGVHETTSVLHISGAGKKQPDGHDHQLPQTCALVVCCLSAAHTALYAIYLAAGACQPPAQQPVPCVQALLQPVMTTLSHYTDWPWALH